MLYFGIIYIVEKSGKMNNKGQALVEFVLILPILLIVLFAIIEFGNMIHKKYILETHMETVIDLYKNDKEEVLVSYEKTNNITTTFKETGNLTRVIISQKVKLITPGLSLVLEDPYTIKAERSFYLDKVPTANE